MQRFGSNTVLQDESCAYPYGAAVRDGIAVDAESGKRIRVRAGIPDTYFTIPAFTGIRGKRRTGYLSVDDDGVLKFYVRRPIG